MIYKEFCEIVAIREFSGFGGRAYSATQENKDFVQMG
jgi:hypothetical protein